jgi:hypothetical protein
LKALALLRGRDAHIYLDRRVGVIERRPWNARPGKPADSFGVLDLMRLPPGIPVGLMGAGAILRRDDLVTGATTAATLWLVKNVHSKVTAGCLSVGNNTGMAASAYNRCSFPVNYQYCLVSSGGGLFSCHEQKFGGGNTVPPGNNVAEIATLLRDRQQSDDDMLVALLQLQECAEYLSKEVKRGRNTGKGVVRLLVVSRKTTR